MKKKLWVIENSYKLRAFSKKRFAKLRLLNIRLLNYGVYDNRKTPL